MSTKQNSSNHPAIASFPPPNPLSSSSAKAQLGTLNSLLDECLDETLVCLYVCLELSSRDAKLGSALLTKLHTATSQFRKSSYTYPHHDFESEVLIMSKWLIFFSGWYASHCSPATPSSSSSSAQPSIPPVCELLHQHELAVSYISEYFKQCSNEQSIISLIVWHLLKINYNSTADLLSYLQEQFLDSKSNPDPQLDTSPSLLSGLLLGLILGDPPNVQ